MSPIWFALPRRRKAPPGPPSPQVDVLYCPVCSPPYPLEPRPPGRYSCFQCGWYGTEAEIWTTSARLYEAWYDAQHPQEPVPVVAPKPPPDPTPPAPPPARPVPERIAPELLATPAYRMDDPPKRRRPSWVSPHSVGSDLGERKRQACDRYGCRWRPGTYCDTCGRGDPDSVR